MDRKRILEIFDEEYKENVGSVSSTLASIKKLIRRANKDMADSFYFTLPNEFGLFGKINHFRRIVVRKLIMFTLKPYADQMLRFEEDIVRLQEEYANEFEMIIQKQKELEARMNSLNRLDTEE